MNEISRIPQQVGPMFKDGTDKIDPPSTQPSAPPQVHSSMPSSKPVQTPVCKNCKTQTTPLWRRDDSGQVLCNACGLFLKLHGRPRPISLKTDTIKSRNRIKSGNNHPSNHHKSMPNTPELRANGDKSRRSSGSSPKNGVKRKSSGDYTPLMIKQSQVGVHHQGSFNGSIPGGATPGLPAVNHPRYPGHNAVQPLHYPTSVPPSFPRGLERITSPLLLSSATQHDRAAASALETMSSNELGQVAYKRVPPPQGVSLIASNPHSAPAPVASTIFSAVNMTESNTATKPEGTTNQGGDNPPPAQPSSSSQAPSNSPSRQPSGSSSAPNNASQPPSGGSPPNNNPAPTSSEVTALKTRISELELVNDLYRTRIIELEAMEQASRLREDSMRHRLEDMMNLANMQGVVPVSNPPQSQYSGAPSQPNYQQSPVAAAPPQGQSPAVPKNDISINPESPGASRQPQQPQQPQQQHQQQQQFAQQQLPQLPQHQPQQQQQHQQHQQQHQQHQQQQQSPQQSVSQQSMAQPPPPPHPQPPVLPSIGASTQLPPPMLPALRSMSSPPQNKQGIVLPSLKRPHEDEGADAKKPRY